MFSNQWEPLRREGYIRTLLDYYKGGQVYRSGINRVRLHALHGDAYTSFELIYNQQQVEFAEYIFG